MTIHQPLLIAEGLRVTYGGILAVRGITFHVDAGEMVALIGANGAGKTSTLKALSRMLDAAGGSIRYQGREVGKLPAHQLIREGIALVPMCPHALTARPITLPDRCRIEIVLLPPHDSRVHFDGQTRYDTRAGDTLQITRSPHRVHLLHPVGYSYFAMLREKLHWSSTPRHG